MFELPSWLYLWCWRYKIEATLHVTCLYLLVSVRYIDVQLLTMPRLLCASLLEIGRENTHSHRRPPINDESTTTTPIAKDLKSVFTFSSFSPRKICDLVLVPATKRWCRLPTSSHHSTIRWWMFICQHRVGAVKARYSGLKLKLGLKFGNCNCLLPGSVGHCSLVDLCCSPAKCRYQHYHLNPAEWIAAKYPKAEVVSVE